MFFLFYMEAGQPTGKGDIKTKLLNNDDQLERMTEMSLMMIELGKKLGRWEAAATVNLEGPLQNVKVQM